MAALPEEQHVVEKCEEGVPRLVDHHDAGHAEVTQPREGEDDGQGARGVQARSGLVEEEDRGLRRELQADVHALALAAADAALLDAADDAVLDVVDLHDVKHVLRDGVNGLGRGPHPVAQAC
mmetsp:Transcript_12748/g.25788  ORF Transcript_12748/g.25788 Transcript_12748/m.25788 type:complete len:122 (-) Transcript_12748:125-490(-)